MREELTLEEAKYVDHMAATIANGMTVNNPNSYNTDYFKQICGTAYKLAIVMLKVRGEQVVVVDKMGILKEAPKEEVQGIREPAEPAKPVEPTKPAEPAKPAKPAEPAGSLVVKPKTRARKPRKTSLALGVSKKKGGRPKGTNDTKKQINTKALKVKQTPTIEPLAAP